MTQLTPPSVQTKPGSLQTCIVTGCAGFVGSHLTEGLLRMGYCVIGIDNFYSGKPENMSRFVNDPSFQFHNCFIEEQDRIAPLFRDAKRLHAVFHLAAVVSVPYSMTHPEETYRINHEASINLLAMAEEAKASRFVFAGSAAEYGAEDRLPVREEYANEATVQLSPYGRAKYLASTATGRSPIGVSLRFFNIFGPRQDPASPYSGVISKFMSQALEDKPLTIFGNGEQSRDFVYVQDVVRAYFAAGGVGIQKPLPAGIYNVGTGTSVTVLSLAWLILVLTGKEKTAMEFIVDDDVSANSNSICQFYPLRSGDITHSVADIHRLVENSGWRAEMVLSAGLARTIAWYAGLLGMKVGSEESPSPDEGMVAAAS